jgi:hypothetical protein
MSIINFITALAWLLGSAAALGALVQLIPPIKPCDVERFWTSFWLGLLPWSWLIARYAL